MMPLSTKTTEEQEAEAGDLYDRISPLMEPQFSLRTCVHALAMLMAESILPLCQHHRDAVRQEFNECLDGILRQEPTPERSRLDA